MALISIPIGVQTAFFIGNFGATGTLERIYTPRTGGIQIREEVPRVYLPFLNSTVQSNLHSVNLATSFLTDTGTVYKVAKGISLSGSVNDAPSNQKYVLFIANAGDNLKSYVLPEVYVESALEVPYNKRGPTAIQIKFTGANRDPEYDLLVQGTLDEMSTYLGSRSPY